MKFSKNVNKVHIFWEGHKSLQNLHCRFDWHYIGQIYGGDFANFCGLFRIYELYEKETSDILRRPKIFEKIFRFVLTLPCNFKIWLEIFFLILWPSQNIWTFMTFSCFETIAFFINNNKYKIVKTKKFV